MASTAEVAEQKVTVEKAAEYLGVSKMTVYRAIRSGELRAYQIGQQFRVPISALREFLGAAATFDGGAA